MTENDVNNVNYKTIIISDICCPSTNANILLYTCLQQNMWPVLKIPQDCKKGKTSPYCMKITYYFHLCFKRVGEGKNAMLEISIPLLGHHQSSSVSAYLYGKLLYTIQVKNVKLALGLSQRTARKVELNKSKYIMISHNCPANGRIIIGCQNVIIHHYMPANYWE